MKYTDWSITSEEFVPEKRQARDALFTVGNGYFGIRGYFEEDSDSKIGNGGTYICGVLGAGYEDAWEGKSRQLCNISHLLRLGITLNGKKLNGTENTENIVRELDLKKALYKRSCTYKGKDGDVELVFERFADRVMVNRVGQKVTIKNGKNPLNLEFDVLIDSNVVNLNKHSIEPLPVQPGLNHIASRKICDNVLYTTLDDADNTVLSFAQQACVTLDGKELKGEDFKTETVLGKKYTCTLLPGSVLELKKIAFVCCDKEWDCGEKALNEFLTDTLSYDKVFSDHCADWEKRWNNSYVDIESDTDDLTALRYDLFELMISCPEHTEKLSIGARGISGEMYEGCIFWDNEIFQVPYFTFTNPEASRRLLAFRYHTLEAAKRHARVNWFSGAMYPWQVSEKGIEQTPRGGGAYYAIHIVADIAYAICQYFKQTNDTDFMLKQGAEILVETSRYWVSRCDLRKRDGKYHIHAVRGPNEYDFYVNDNAYTNIMAAENLRAAVNILNVLSKTYPKETAELTMRLEITDEECGKWLHIADNMHVERDGDLVVEDEHYLDRRQLDLKVAKPTAKRILDSTMTYEMMPFYSVTKQSDAVTLMCLKPELFSEKEMKTAYDFYEPRTAHDSSLSYAPYSLLAAKIGYADEAYDYFTRCAYLDINDMKLNTVSGLHFANFGGTWQIVAFGFAGITILNDGIHISPSLPKKWKRLKISFIYRGARLLLDIKSDNDFCVTAENIGTKIPICLKDQWFELSKDNKSVSFGGK